MQFRDTCQCTDISGIRGDGFPDSFHLGIVALESLIVVLLTGREFPVALGHLFLKLPLAQCQFLEYTLNTVQPVAAIRHVLKSLTSAYHRPPPMAAKRQDRLPSVRWLSFDGMA